MERQNLGGELFQLVTIYLEDYLEENDLKLNRGTIVDATIIDAPRSTKNKKRQRDPSNSVFTVQLLNCWLLIFVVLICWAVG